MERAPEEANFTRAARRVHITQSGVSAQVRQLERELGADLSDRSTRTATLTPAGAAALGPARAALAAEEARTCCDHLVGRLGVELLDALVDRGLVGGHDGSFRRGLDRLSAGGRDLIYHLTAAGAVALIDLGVDATRAPLTASAGVRHCVDWSEQRHHLAGRVGAALADRLFELGWIARGTVRRTVVPTDTGRTGVDAPFGITGLSLA